MRHRKIITPLLLTFWLLSLSVAVYVTFTRATLGSTDGIATAQDFGWKYTPETPYNITGLVLRLKMNEGSGNNASDVSGEGNHGTLCNNTVTNEAITVSSLDVWYNLAEDQLLSGTVTVKNETTSFTENADYAVNYTLGQIKGLSGGSIVAGDDVNVTYAHIGPDWVDGKFGKALIFDGNDYILVASSTSLNVNKITLAVWVKLSIAADTHAVIAKRDNSGNQYELRINNDGTIWFYWENPLGGTTRGYIGSNAVITLGVWAHVVATYDGAVYKIYVNGVQKVSGNEANPFVDSNIPSYIGCWGGSEQFVNGIIDEVRIYNRALTSDEILNDYRQTALTITSYAYYWAENSVNVTYHWDFNKTFPKDYCTDRELNLTIPKGHSILNITYSPYSSALSASDYFTSSKNSLHDLLTISESTIASYGGDYRIFTHAWLYDISANDTRASAGGSPNKSDSNYTLSFDGRNAFVEIPNSVSLNITKQITIELWIYPTDLSITRGILTKYNWGLGTYRGNILFYLRLNRTGWISFGAHVEEHLNENHWYYVAATYNGEKAMTFVNGEIDSVYTVNDKILSSSAHSLIISSWVDPTAYPWKGMIDEVKITNVALNEEEIKANYHQKAEFEVDDHTVALWHFNEGNGDVVYDESPNHNDGTIYFAEWTPQSFLTPLSPLEEIVFFLTTPFLEVTPLTVIITVLVFVSILVVLNSKGIVLFSN